MEKHPTLALVAGIMCTACASASNLRITCWDYRDQTDAHEELCHSQEWLLGRHEAPCQVRANVLDVFDALRGTGVVWFVEGPVPLSRADDSPDFTVSGKGVQVHSNGCSVVGLRYAGGRWGRIRALHRHQRESRPYKPQRDGLILSNTWGDRHRFARINEADMLKEVSAAADLGVDVMQIDAGWAVVNDLPRELVTGPGEWQRYWNMPRECWNVNTNRFPRGLRPIADAAKARGMAFGLWFAPDCADESAHWRRDAEILLSLWRNEGVRFFKTDFMSARTHLARQNQLAFFAAVLDGSNGDVSIDLDVTGQVPRLGYFGAPQCSVFVENRYQRKGDGRLWWPHRTLRNLWTLSEAIDPIRLRMEFMNPARHPELYGDSPLAPQKWPADAIFATVMAASPLAWMDCVDVPAAVLAKWRPLIDTWKRERRSWYGGTIIPVGNRPDGVSWTGFVSVSEPGEAGYALLFREHAAESRYSLEFPSELAGGWRKAEVIGGRGRAEICGNKLMVDVPAQLDFIWVKLAGGPMAGGCRAPGELETDCWQAKIDAAAAAGGGVVCVPPGRHPVGQLYLKSNVELRLEKGAVLEGVPGLHNYVVHALPFSEGTWSAVVMGLNVTNVAITGEGEIFGNGASFEKMSTKGVCQEGFRPRGVFFSNCRGIRLEDFTLRDAACWGIVLKCCDGMTARHVRIDSVANHNNDGFDIEAKNVLIEDCEVESGDDAFCVKSNDPGFTVENVTVRRCVARSHCNGFKLGTASHGTMRNVRFEHCRAELPRRVYRDLAPMPTNLLRWPVVPGAVSYLCGPGIGAICVECVDGGTVEDVVCDDIEVSGFQVPIFVRGGRRLKRTCGIPPGDKCVLRNVTIANIRGRAEQILASSVTGVEGCRPRGITLRNIDLECVGEGENAKPFSLPGPEAAGRYPEATMFRSWHLPAYGLFVDQADDVKLENVRLTLRAGTTDARPAVYDVSVKGGEK